MFSFLVNEGDFDESSHSFFSPLSSHSSLIPSYCCNHLEAGHLHGQAEPGLRESRLQGLLVHGWSTEPEIPSSSWGTEDTIDMEWRERNNCLGSLPLNSNMGSQVLQKGGSSCNR